MKRWSKVEEMILEMSFDEKENSKSIYRRTKEVQKSLDQLVKMREPNHGVYNRTFDAIRCKARRMGLISNLYKYGLLGKALRKGLFNLIDKKKKEEHK